MYYLLKFLEIPFIEVRYVRECMKAVGNRSLLSLKFDPYDGTVVKETMLADRYLVG